MFSVLGIWALPRCLALSFNMSLLWWPPIACLLCTLAFLGFLFPFIFPYLLSVLFRLFAHHPCCRRLSLLSPYLCSSSTQYADYWPYNSPCSKNVLRCSAHMFEKTDFSWSTLKIKKKGSHHLIWLIESEQGWQSSWNTAKEGIVQISPPKAENLILKED